MSGLKLMVYFNGNVELFEDSRFDYGTIWDKKQFWYLFRLLGQAKNARLKKVAEGYEIYINEDAPTRTKKPYYGWRRKSIG